MKRLLPLVAAALLITTVGITSARAAGGTDHFGPFPSTSDDGGSCGQPWAHDTFNREFTVHDNGDGTFRVTEEFKNGTFVTIGGAAPSPGACSTAQHHGSTVVAGVRGSFQGSLSGTVTSATYTPGACSPATCNTTAGFISTVFGPSAAFDITKFNFEYDSPDKRLAYHHWQDKSDNGPTGEQFIGDIATQ